jgi:hypothetical protein
MKTIKLLSLTITALVGLSQPAWAGGHGGGHFGGGGFGGGHFSGGHFGGFHAAPNAFGGARFAGTSIGGLSRAPRFSYGSHMPVVRSHGFNASDAGSTTRYSAGSRTAMAHQPTRVASLGARSSDPGSKSRTAQNRHASSWRNRVYARHESSWHHDWDKHRAHYWGGHWWRYYGGYWIGFDTGFYPFDLYPYGDYPYDYYGYPYDYYDYQPYDYGNDYGYADAVVSAVQSKLAELGYYHGAIDGLLGDQTEDALARYQEDHDLSVTGTPTAATLQSLGVT